MAHSSHKRFRGHCYLCATRCMKIKGVGRRERDAHRDHKRIGKARRITRHDLGD